MPFQRADSLTALNVPQKNLPTNPRRSQHRSPVDELHRNDVPLVPLEHDDLTLILHRPQPHRTVIRGRRRPSTVRRHLDRRDSVRMALQRAKQRPFTKIPYAHRPVRRPRHKRRPVLCKCPAVDALAMPRKRPDQLELRHRPHLHRRVLPNRDELPAVRRRRSPPGRVEPKSASQL